MIQITFLPPSLFPLPPLSSLLPPSPSLGQKVETQSESLSLCRSQLPISLVTHTSADLIPLSVKNCSIILVINFQLGIIHGQALT